MESATVKDVMSWNLGPDYQKSRIHDLWAGRERLTAAEIAILDMPSKYVLWILLHMLTQRQQHEIALEIVECILYQANDPRLSSAVDVKRNWLLGKATDTDVIFAALKVHRIRIEGDYNHRITAAAVTWALKTDTMDARAVWAVAINTAQIYGKQSFGVFIDTAVAMIEKSS